MRKRGISRTAMGAAFCRLVEQQQPAGLRQFDDPVVERVIDPMMRAMAMPGPMQDQLLESLGQGTYGCQVVRTRYIDEVVTAAVADGVGQVVILGAGLDTRAYRLSALAAATLVEVDLPEIQAVKVKRLRGTVPQAGRLVHLPLDLARQPLGEPLAGVGFDDSRPAIFIWEGVTQYLTAPVATSTLSFIGGHAAGSQVVFSYLLRGVVEGTIGHEWSATLRRTLGAAEPWLFGLEPSEVPLLLDRCGLTLVEDVGESNYRRRYLEPDGRRLEVSPGERVVHARVSDHGA